MCSMECCLDVTWTVTWMLTWKQSSMFTWPHTTLFLVVCTCDTFDDKYVIFKLPFETFTWNITSLRIHCSQPCCQNVFQVVFSIWTWNFTQNFIWSLEFMNFFWFWLKPHLKIHVSLTFRVVSLVRLENVLDLYKSWFDVNFHLEAYLKFNLIPWETRRLLNPFTWNIVTWHI